ncbi:hypothetical protein K461DRAFT_67198 [Myriangium duriaei CBS 260.36]|uniref:Uncharacterized protein n=1 Tax=Myriangium duriaei CBS 260.36 TaxID=1168546 RepID=A0A9P4ITD8_9PEZI|nr:hypothetical protein K461DRAFT_67198 [Myriangium duriaei CBS 260.36]
MRTLYAEFGNHASLSCDAINPGGFVNQNNHGTFSRRADRWPHLRRIQAASAHRRPSPQCYRCGVLRADPEQLPIRHQLHAGSVRNPVIAMDTTGPFFRIYDRGVVPTTRWMPQRSLATESRECKSAHASPASAPMASTVCATHARRSRSERQRTRSERGHHCSRNQSRLYEVRSDVIGKVLWGMFDKDIFDGSPFRGLVGSWMSAHSCGC